MAKNLSHFHHHRLTTIHTRIVTASTFLRALITIDGSVVASNRCCDVCVCMERRTKHQIGLYVTLREKTRLKSEKITN